MKPDPSDIDSQMAEIRIRIDVLTQRMTEQGASLTDLHDRITACLKKDVGIARRKKLTELQEIVLELLREQEQWAREYKKLHKEYAELEKMKNITVSKK